MDVPEIEYARSGDVAIAYQLLGNGPVDLVFFRGMAGDLLSTWDQPLLVRLPTDFARFARVLMFDKRGTGLSDRVRQAPTLETRMARALSQRGSRSRRARGSPPPRARGEVLVSSTVSDLVAGSEMSFEDRGRHELKGVGEWNLYAVTA